MPFLLRRLYLMRRGGETEGRRYVVSRYVTGNK